MTARDVRRTSQRPAEHACHANEAGPAQAAVRDLIIAHKSE
jgi:hypothetical protein